VKVLVDTSIWSLALRRNSDLYRKEVRELLELIAEYRVVIIGPIRQELLSGISDKIIYDNLKEKLSSFEDVELKTDHYEYAAELFNRCRSNGVQGSHIDFLICSVSIKNNYSIYTMDKDFFNYVKYTDIRLHAVRDNII